MVNNSWWPEKYRPTTLDNFAANKEFIDIASNWIKKQDAPHFIAYSPHSGTGKTTICRIVAKALNAEIVEINGSKDNNMETVRDKITDFATRRSFAQWKVVIINEFSYFTHNAQSALLDVIERSSSDTRFFLTGNYIEKFLPAIVSRCQPFLIQSPSAETIFSNLKKIMAAENVEYSPEDLVKVIRVNYPDQRKMLNYLQSNCINGKFVYNEATLQVNDYCSKVIGILKDANKQPRDKYTEVRQLFADAKVRQFDDLFKTLYERLDEYAPITKHSVAIAAIADGQYRHNFVVDKEIQAMNCVNNIILQCK